MNTQRLRITALAFLLTAGNAFAHHLPPGMEEVDEFGNETLRSQIIHPFTGVDHWLLSLGIVSWLALGCQFLAQRKNHTALERRPKVL